MPRKRFAYIRKPKGFNPKFEAVSCYCVLEDGRILFLKRSDNDDSEPGKWGVPTGRKKEYEKSDVETLIREIREETHMNFEKYRSYFSYSSEFFMRYDKFDFICRTYVMNLTDEMGLKITLSPEHSRFDWLRLLEAPFALDLVSGLKEILLKLETRSLIRKIIRKKLIKS